MDNFSLENDAQKLAAIVQIHEITIRSTDQELANVLVKYIYKHLASFGVNASQYKDQINMIYETVKSGDGFMLLLPYFAGGQEEIARKSLIDASRICIFTVSYPRNDSGP